VSFIFQIDGNTVQPPDNWEEFEEELVRDDTQRHVYYNYPLELEFIGLGYDLLNRQYKDNYNSQVSLRIIEETTTGPQILVDTLIKISNCTFDLVKKSVLVEVDDASYQAYIFNNYKVEVGPNPGTTKNGEDIATISHINLKVFNPFDGSEYPLIRKSWDVKDFMGQIISYITDNTVGFESSWYDALPTDQKLCVCLGNTLRTASKDRDLVLSLAVLFEELWKKYNLYLIIENPLVSPLVRLEEESYLYNNSNEIRVIAASNLKRSLDFDKLYNNIKLGSDKAIREYQNVFYLPYFNFFTFTEEQYTIGGVIGVDNTLDLVSKFVIDTNVFQDVLQNNNDQYDDDIFLIQYDTTTVTATKGTYYDGGFPNRRYYNEQLLNSLVASRFNYLGSLILDSGLPQSGFRASTNNSFFNGVITGATASPVTFYSTNAYEYNDDSTPPNFDIGNDYDNTTFTFTAPFTGAYRFGASVLLTVNNVINNDPRYGLIGKFRKNGNPQDQDEYVVTIDPNTGSDPWTEEISSANMIIAPIVLYTQWTGATVEVYFERTLLLDVNDTVTVEVDAQVGGGPTNPSANVTISEGVFLTEANPFSGGEYIAQDPNNYYLGLLTSESIAVEKESWETVRQNPNVLVKIDAGDGEVRRAYPKQISRKFATGETDFELLFNRLQAVI